MNDLRAAADELKIQQIDEQLKIELKRFYEDLAAQASEINCGEGKINITISGTQIFQNIEISEDWLSHSAKREIEKQLLDGINFALGVSLETGNKKLAEFYTKILNSSAEIKRVIQSGATADTTGNLMKVNQAVKSEVIQEKSANEDIVAVFAGGRRLVSINISQELINTKDCKAIGEQLVDVLNKAVNKSRKYLMNKFGPASSS